ncbi:sulfur oxidation c-type cytochrome SoxX [Ectothiorhodospiraceae bacterium 2226]|nr:sulfur oxidation c-type cytochrome SoxX [Ectothiorhodospiraceae bacterium 2226]
MAAILGAFAVVPGVAVAQEQQKSAAEEGKEIAFDRRKGNCLACHMVPGGESPGNIAPPLVAMKDRFPDKAKLRAQVWDATQFNPLSMMPPFGRHEILTEQEIDKIVEFLYTI